MDNPRVLIIEDNDVLRAMLFTILRHQPVGVDTAATAADAIERVLTCDYALILIDMHLPEKQSDRFLRDFQQQRPDTTSFVIAVRDPREETIIESPLVVAVLNKPIEIDMLTEVVRECAFLVPQPADPRHCPPSESDLRMRLDRSPYLSN